MSLVQILGLAFLDTGCLSFPARVLAWKKHRTRGLYVDDFLGKVKLIGSLLNPDAVWMCLLSAEVVATHEEALFLLEVSVHGGHPQEASWYVLLDGCPSPLVFDLLG